MSGQEMGKKSQESTVRPESKEASEDLEVPSKEQTLRGACRLDRG